MGSWLIQLILVSSLHVLILANITTQHLTQNQQAYAFVRERDSQRGDDEHLSDADTYLIPSDVYTLKASVVIPALKQSANGIDPDNTLTLSLHPRRMCGPSYGSLKVKIMFTGGDYTVITANAKPSRDYQLFDIRCSQGAGGADYQTTLDTLPGGNLLKLPPTCIGNLEKFRDELVGVNIEMLSTADCYPHLVAAYPSIILEDNTEIELIQPPGPWFNATHQAPVDVPVTVDGVLNQVEIKITQSTSYPITFANDPTAKYPIMRFYIDENVTDFETTIRFYENPDCDLFISVKSQHITTFETSGTRELRGSGETQEVYKPHTSLRRWHVNYPDLRFLEDSYDQGGTAVGSVQLCSKITATDYPFLSVQVVPDSVKGECTKCVLIVGGSLSSEHHKANLIGFSVPEDATKLVKASLLSTGLIIGIGLLAFGLFMISIVVYISIHTYRKRKRRKERLLQAEKLQAQGRQWAEETSEKKKLTSTDVNSNRSPGTLSRIIAAEQENGPIANQPLHLPRVIVPKVSKIKVVDDLVSRERSSDNKTDEVIVPTEFDYHAYENFEKYEVAGVRPYQSEPPMVFHAFQDFWDIFDYFMSTDKAMPVAAMGAKNENVFFAVRDCVAVPRKGFRSLANRMLEPINPKKLPQRKPESPPIIVVRIFVLSYDPPWIEIHCRGPPPAFLFTIFDCQECQKFGTQLNDTAGLISDALILKPWKEFCCEVKRIEIDRHRFVSYCDGGFVQPKEATAVDHLLTIRGRGNSPALPKCARGCTIPAEAVGHANEKELHCFILNGVKSLPGTRFTQVNGDGTVVPTGLPPPAKKPSEIVPVPASSFAPHSEVQTIKNANIPQATTSPNNNAKPSEAQLTAPSQLTSDNRGQVDAVPPLGTPTAVRFDSVKAPNTLTSRTGESALTSKEDQKKSQYAL